MSMPWKTMDVREQRVRFVVAALRRERSLSSLCREFEISRPTGRLWLERYRTGGVEAIAERSRRPLHSPRQTEPELEQRVVELRMRYPDWGARKLQVLLGAGGIPLPPSTIHRILLRHQLVHEQDRHRPAQRRFERATPNELWQMDFKGPKSWPQPMGPLSVLDDHSRYAIALEALGSTHAAPVRERLEQAFVECGMPQAMLMDHGVPWWSWAGPQAATTGLALWLDETGHTAALERHRPSADARQGRALSRRAAARAEQAWVRRRVATALVGRLSLGTQPFAPPPGAGHADSGQPLEPQPAALRSSSAVLAISRRSLGAEGRLPGQAGHP